MRGPFDVWAPRAAALKLSVGGETVELTKGPDDWWTPAGPVPDPTQEVDYGYLIDDEDTPRPDPRSRRQPAGVHQLAGEGRSLFLGVGVIDLVEQ